MNIVIRVNVSQTEGAGHFNRVITLANEIKKKNSNVYFLCNKIQKNFINLIIKNKFKYILIKNFSSLDYELKDINYTIKAIKKIKKPINVIILDSYLLGYKWEKNLINYTDKMIVLDDLDRKHFCDLYISPLTLPTKKKILNSGCKILTGLKYLIIKNVKIKKKSSPADKILIYMGEADKNNLTLKLLKILSKKIFHKFRFQVLIGNNNINRFKLLKTIRKMKNVSHTVFQKSLSKILSKINIGIIGGGSTVFELITNKIPLLIICQNIQQYKIIKRNKICNFKYLLKFKKYSNKYLEDFLKLNLINSKITSNNNKLDFLACKRISKYI
jgi:UDP-2,4-diacetamido-2,4,6-trideoxy-beta-L-altropyranose hydrolase